MLRNSEMVSFTSTVPRILLSSVVRIILYSHLVNIASGYRVLPESLTTKPNMNLLDIMSHLLVLRSLYLEPHFGASFSSWCSLLWNRIPVNAYTWVNWKVPGYLLDGLGDINKGVLSLKKPVTVYHLFHVWTSWRDFLFQWDIEYIYLIILLVYVWSHPNWNIGTFYCITWKLANLHDLKRHASTPL